MAKFFEEMGGARCCGESWKVDGGFMGGCHGGAIRNSDGDGNGGWFSVGAGGVPH